MQSKDPWVLVIAVTISGAIGLLPQMIVPFLIGGVIDSLGFSEMQAGALGSVELVGIAVTTVFAAPFMARLSVVKVALYGGILAASSQLGSALLDSFWPLLLARLGAGIGAGLIVAAATAAAAGTRNPDRIFGLLSAAVMVVTALMTAIETAAIGAMGMVGGYGALGVLYLAGLPLAVWLGRASRPAAISGGAGRRRLPRGQLVLLLALATIIALGPGPTWTSMERIGVGIGIGLERVGNYYSIAVLCGIAGALGAGALGWRWGRRGPLALSVLLLGAACLGVSTVSAEAGYAIMMLLLLVSYLFAYTYVMATVAVFDPTGRAGPAAAGLYSLALGFGPGLGGYLVSADSFALTGWFAVGVCGFGALLVLLNGSPLNRLGARSS